MNVRQFIGLLLIALCATALFLGVSLLSDISAQTGPNMATVVGFLVTVLICVSLGSWIAFTGEKKHSFLLLVSLFLCSGLVFVLGAVFSLDLAMSSPAWKEYHPLAVFNLSLTIDCLYALAFILAIGVIIVLISIARDSEV